MKYKTEWDLTHIYKANPKKSAEKDCAALKKAYSTFAKKYRKDKSYLKNPKALAKAIEDYEKAILVKGFENPILYYWYIKNIDSQNTEAEAQVTKLSEFYSDLSNQVSFFTLEIGKIPAQLQKKFLGSKELAPYRYLLKQLFDNAKHTLSEAEEKIIELKSLPAHQLWTSGFSKLLAKQMVKFNGEEIALEEALSKLRFLPKTERHALYKEVTSLYKSVSDFAESEMNAIVTNKKINDKLKGFKFPYEATAKAYENEVKTVQNLRAAVTSNFKIAHRFYKIKAEMMGEKKLAYVDRLAQIGKSEVKITLEEAINKTIEAFRPVGEDFAEFVRNEFENGLVDVYPRKGKRSGGFCSWSIGTPVYIFLNHTDDFRSLTTIAHEMGHGIHAMYSRKQRPLYEDVTIATAEVASTFFENLVYEQELAKVNEEERMVLLHDKIGDDINTIFRQIACFNFEEELHNTIREEGFLSKERIAALMSKHVHACIGPTFDMTEDDGYTFVMWSHIRKFFYVYTYAFGQLISDALYERYKKDNSKIKDVIKFLSAGGSDSPEGIFRSIGINPTKQFFELGLKRIERDIDELERLWKKHKNTKK
jgi:oligoendopeptidase F